MDADMKDLQIFVAVVQHGSVAGAAGALRVAKSSVSRAMARLQAALDTALFDRVGRNLELNATGRRLYARVEAPLAAIAEATREATNQDVPRGHVRLSAPIGVGSELLPGLVAAFVRRNPEVTVAIKLDSDPAAAMRDGFDMAIVGGRLEDSSHRCRRLVVSPFRAYASPSYEARRGLPRAPEQLEQHEVIIFGGPHTHATWELTGPEGPRPVRVSGRVVANSLAFVRQAATAGLGIALLPETPGRLAVDRGLLVPVLPEFALYGDPLSILYRPGPHLPSRVTRLLEFLIEQFQSPVTLEPHDLD